MEQIEEVLKWSDISGVAITPYLVEREVLEGSRPVLVAHQLVREDRRLINAPGDNIRVPTATQLTAGNFSEGTTDYETILAEKTISKVTISVDKHKYSNYGVTQTLLENQPDIAWIRLGLRNTGAAVAEAIDSDIITTLIAGVDSTHIVSPGTSGALNYDDVVNARAKMLADDWSPAYLLVHPDQEADLLKDTKFIDASKYGSPDVLLNGEIGRFAGLTVLKSTQIPSGSALLAVSPNYKYGPSAYIAYKRPIETGQKEFENKETVVYWASARYGVGVAQGKALASISYC